MSDLSMVLLAAGSGVVGYWIVGHIIERVRPSKSASGSWGPRAARPRGRTTESRSGDESPSGGQAAEYARVLGLRMPFSEEQLLARYEQLKRLHHPDRVAGLGPRMRALAEQQIEAIDEAYDYLRRSLDSARK